MAEPPAAVAVDAAASERDLLLATKLHVPATRSDLVPRPRLAKPLDGGWGLVLVCAPAGYGKTVLLAEWAALGGGRVGWLSLDAGDNDPARFWRHAVAALDRIRPGIGERLTSLLGPPAPLSYDGVVTALVNELAAAPDVDEITLILDDYHVISSQPVHASLEFLLEHRPPGLRVLISSRSDPPLALARLRARGSSSTSSANRSLHCFSRSSWHRSRSATPWASTARPSPIASGRACCRSRASC